MFDILGSLSFTAWILIIFCSIFFSLIGNLVFSSKEEAVHKRIESLNIFVSGTEEDKVKNKTLYDRMKIMMEERIARYMEKNIKKGKLAPLELKLQQAEINMDPIQHWTQKFMYLIMFSAVILGASAAIESLRSPLVFIGACILGFLLPDINLSDKIKKRQLRIKSELPDFLDLLAATAPSAKNLEDAIKRVCERTDGEVTREFKIALEQINAGKRTKNALKDLSLRCGVAEIDTLIAQINQAEAFGTGVEKTLVVQADKMRKLKKQLAEIRANKAAVTLILPTIFLLGTVLVIIVGPSIVALLDAQSAFQ